MQPNFVNEEHINQVKEEVSLKKELPSLDKIKFITINEGLSAQILHIAPFYEEGPTVKKIHDTIQEKNY